MMQNTKLACNTGEAQAGNSKGRVAGRVVGTCWREQGRHRQGMKCVGGVSIDLLQSHVRGEKNAAGRTAPTRSSKIQARQHCAQWCG